MSNTNGTPDPRAEYIAGLRMLADLLEAHPEVMTPHRQIQVIPLGAEVCREQLAAWARALPGKKDKEIGDRMVTLVGWLRGVKVQVLAYRDEVCERITTGVETVTREVPDPEALAKVPTVTITEEVETYEWRCASILAGAAS